MKILNYITARLTEASSWFGIIAFATVLGVNFTPELSGLVTSAGVALASLLAFVIREK